MASMIKQMWLKSFKFTASLNIEMVKIWKYHQFSKSLEERCFKVTLVWCNNSDGAGCSCQGLLWNAGTGVCWQPPGKSSAMDIARVFQLVRWFATAVPLSGDKKENRMEGRDPSRGGGFD